MMVLQEAIDHLSSRTASQTPPPLPSDSAMRVPEADQTRSANDMDDAVILLGKSEP